MGQLIKILLIRLNNRFPFHHLDLPSQDINLFIFIL